MWLGTAFLFTGACRLSARALSTGARDVSKLPRLHLEIDLRVGDAVQLGGDDAHYISNVMRVKPGFCFRGFNARQGQGEYLCEITEKSSKRDGMVSTVVKSQLRAYDAALSSSLPATLYFAPVKKPKLKVMMEKATELGLSSLVPVISQNVNADIDFVKDESYIRVIMESVEQCERLDVPTLSTNPLTLSELLEQQQGSRLLVCRERSQEAHPLLNVLLSDKESYFGANKKDWGLLVGPEGGFTAHELDQMAACPQVTFVSLGQNVLRAETASITALACVSSVQELYRM